MAGSGPFGDPKIEMRQAVRDIHEALRAAREGVVTAVMQRNRAQDAVAKLERTIADLDAKAGVADKIPNAKLAAELREERVRRAAELEDARKLADRLTAAAESAKLELPEQEARLLQQARELQTRLIESAGATIDSNAAEDFGTEADALFDRVRAKTRDLQNEASARSEVAGSRTGGASATTAIGSVAAPGEQTAEQMLAALEARLGISSRPLRAEPDMSMPGAAAAPKVTAAGMPQATAVMPATPPEASGSAGPVAPIAAAPDGPREESAAKTEAPPEPGQAAAAAASSADAQAVPLQNHPSYSSHTTYLATTAAKGDTNRMNPTQRVRVAAIGTGNIFRGAHLPAYPDIAQAQLVAFCDPDPEAQKAVLKRYKELMDAKHKQAVERGDQETAERVERDRESIRVYADISEVIETVKPDLVDICTQPMLHAPLSIQALEAGINVMCEKPISRSWLESQRVIEAVKRTGKFYQHNENWLWDREWYTAKKLVDAGAIGEPILMFLATAHGGPEGAGRFWNSDYGGGGALLDNGIHAIGASWYVSGLEKRPTYVKAAQPYGMSIRMPNRILDGRFQKVRVDDDAHILIRFEDPDTLAWTTAHVEGKLEPSRFARHGGHRDDRQNPVRQRGEPPLRRGDGLLRPRGAPDRGERPDLAALALLVLRRDSQHGGKRPDNVPSISDASFGAECSAVVGASYLSERDGRRAVTVEEFKTFARGFAERYPNDPAAADNALVDALLSGGEEVVRKLWASGIEIPV